MTKYATCFATLVLTALASSASAQSLDQILAQLDPIKISSVESLPLEGAMFVEMPSGNRYVVGGSCWPLDEKLSPAKRKIIGRKASHLGARGAIAEWLQVQTRDIQGSSLDARVDGKDQFTENLESFADETIRGAQTIRGFIPKDSDGVSSMEYCTNVGISATSSNAASEFQREMNNPRPVQVPRPKSEDTKPEDWVSPEF